jgi:hypothetical protein
MDFVHDVGRQIRKNRERIPRMGLINPVKWIDTIVGIL